MRVVIPLYDRFTALDAVPAQRRRAPRTRPVPAAADLLEAFGATYTAQRVVFQGKIVTAAGVSAGIDMALHLAERIAGQTHAEATQLMIEYDPQPPFHAGSPATAQQAAKDLIAAGQLG